MPLSLGDKLGPYEILAPIGKGGMGEVYRAHDARLNRDVAVKVSAAQFGERFEREARAVAALNHPNICTLHDVGPDYLVMELVEGKPLKGPLPPEDALRYAAQICDALEHAHRKGVVHRDLKPANILLTRQGIKLLDFGLARVTPAQEDTTLTQLTREGVRMGTPAYMAPEQWEGKPGDARSDIFSFGCVLYEMLTGRRSTQERDPLESPALESVVKMCLEKDPEDRWQSARDVKQALALSGAAPPNDQRHSSRAPVWLAAAAAVLFAALAGWAFLRSSTAGSEDNQAYRFQIVLPQDTIVASGFSNTLTLSPDGRMAAFVLELNRKNGVWIQELSGTSARLIPGSEGAVFVVWSPDSKSLAFRVAGQLFRFDLASSAPVVIAPLPVGPIFGADWGADGTEAGTIVLAAARGLVRVPGSGGTPAPSVPDASVLATFPRIIPGGRFLYTGAAKPGVFGVSLDHPDAPVQILKENAAPFYAPPRNAKRGAGNSPGNNGHLVWIRDKTLLAQELDPGTLRLSGEPTVIADPAWNVAVSSNLLLYDPAAPVHQLAWVDRAGSVIQTIGDPGQFSFTGLSADGAHVAISVSPTPSVPDVNLWKLETSRGVLNRVSTRPGAHLSPVWSPDGRTVLFGSPQGLGRIAANGVGEEEHILSRSRLLNPTDWSKNGFVLFVELALEEGTGINVMMLPVTPDGKPTGPALPYVTKPKDQEEAHFSPKGDWVAYQSNESGRSEIFIDTFPEPHGATQVSTAGGFAPRWNPQGGELVYRSPEGKLMSVLIRLDKSSADQSAPRELFAMPVNPAPNQGAMYDVGPDGKRFLIEIPVKKPPLNAIVNWQALLKK